MCTYITYTNTYVYIYYIYILFNYGSSQDIEYSSPCYYSRTLLIIHYIYDSLHLLIRKLPIFLSPTHSVPWQSQVCSLWLRFCFVDRFLCALVQIPHISDTTWYLSSLSDILHLVWSSLVWPSVDSATIHITANDIVSSLIKIF